MLCIGLSSNDYVGHAFGPYSLEVEDITLRNGLRGVVIHCISVSRSSTLLETLAEATP